MKDKVTSVLAAGMVLAVITALTLAVAGLPVAKSIAWMLTGSLASELAWARTLNQMTPLALCGAAILTAKRAGMFNIGAEGQFITGGIAGATVFHLLPRLPGPVLLILIITASVVGGAAFAWLPAWLFARRGVLVVISTILLNFVAINALNLATHTVLKDKSNPLPLTAHLPKDAMIPTFNDRTDLHAGTIVAITTTIATVVILRRSRWGLLSKAAGENPKVLRALRISPTKIQMQAMVASGALCGLAGGVEYTALAGQLGESFSQNWGFLGIPVALLGGANGEGILLSAFAFGALFAGTNHLSRFTQGGTSLVYVIQAVMLFVVLAWSARGSPATANEAGT